MSKTTTPNGAATGAGAFLAQLFPGFEADSNFGEEQSRKVGGDPRVLENFLFMFYDQDNATAALRQEIYQLGRENERHRGAIAQHQDRVEGMRETAQNYINERDRLVAERQDGIATRKVETRRIRGGDYTLLGTDAHPANRLAYWIAAIILILLTGYLISFYASVIYNAFLLDPVQLAMRQADQSIVSTVTITNVRAFPEVFREYGVLGVLFLLTGTFMFITLGFLVYWFSHSRRSIWQYALYIFTFLFDAFLAYEIVEKIHTSEAIVNEVEPWSFRMAFQQMEFYIILCAGFGIYIAWGLLLKYVLEEFYKILPALAGIRRRKAEIARLEQEVRETKETFGQKISQLNSEVGEVEQREIGFFRHAIEQNESRINSLREKLRNHLKNNGTNAQSLRVHVTSFLTGWCKSVRAQQPDKEAEALVGQCHSVVDNFYQTIGLN